MSVQIWSSQCNAKYSASLVMSADTCQVTSNFTSYTDTHTVLDLHMILDSGKYLNDTINLQGSMSMYAIGNFVLVISYTPSLHQSSSAPLFIQFLDKRPRAVIFCALRNSKLLMQLRSSNSSLLGTTEVFHLK